MAYESIGRAGSIFADALAGKQQKRKDDDFLAYLTGQLEQSQQSAEAAIPLPAVPQASPPQPMADLGMGISDVTQGAPMGNQLPGPTPDDMLTAKKQAASSLFESPEKTMSILVEAKKRGAGPGVGGILEYIQDLQKQKHLSAETDKRMKATSETAAARERARLSAQEARDRLQERLAGDRNDTALEGARIRAEASRYGVDNRPRPGGKPNIESMSVEDLYRLQDETEADMDLLEAPAKSNYDEYNALDKQAWGQDHSAYTKTKVEYKAFLRDIKRAITLKERGAPSRQTPAAEPAGQPGAGAPAPAAALSSRSGDQEIAAYLYKNSKDSSAASVQKYRQLLQQNGR